MSVQFSIVAIARVRMKDRGTQLLFFMLTLHCVSLFGQSFIGPAPWFTLSISEKRLGSSYPADAHAVELKYTNVSHFVQMDNCVTIVGVYQVGILRDGVSIHKKELPKMPSKRPLDSTGIPIQVPSTGVVPCGRIIEGIKSGESVRLPLWVSSEFDMSKPGKYEITVIRDVILPGSPSRKVTVKSNTVTVVVPERYPQAQH